MSLLLPVLCALACAPTSDETWPGFRGDGSGTSAARALPLRWSPDEGIAWRVAVPGYGQSSPVVWQGRVFLTSVDGPNMERCFVHAFDLEDGRRIWTRELAATQPVENYFRNSRAAPTCVVDGRYVHAFFAGGDVVCLTHEGETVWQRSLVEEHGAFQSERGVASSLGQTDAAVIVLVDHDGPSYLLALAKESGQMLWKVDRGVRGAAWTSPLVTRFAGTEMVIVSSAGTVEAYDGGSGDGLWRLGGFAGNRIPSAGILGDRVLVGATQSAHGTEDPHLVRRSNRCLQLTGTPGRLGCKTLWTAQRADPHYATPLAYEGCVYYLTSSGILHCLDLESGEPLYVQRVAGPSWASAIGAGGHVYFFLKDGSVLVVKAGPVYEEVATNRLWSDEGGAPEEELPPAAFRPPVSQDGEPVDPEQALRGLDLEVQQRLFSYFDPVVYGAAAVDGRLVVRTGQELYCVVGTSGDAPRPVDEPRRERER